MNGYNTTKGDLELKELKLGDSYTPTKVSASRILFYNNDDNANSNQDYRLTTRRTESSGEETSKKLRLNDQPGDDASFFGLSGSQSGHMSSLTSILLVVSSVELFRLFF